MKVTVIGAGAIGSAVAYYLLKREEVSQVQVCDARARSLQAVQNWVQSNRLRSFQVDARDASLLSSIISSSECVIACVPTNINTAVARLCLKHRIHYCDLGGSEKMVQRTLDLHEEARARAVWLVPNCGLAPGLINVLCLRGVEQFDEVEAAHLRVGDVPLYPKPPFNFRISWSAEKVLDDYTETVYLIDEGEVKEAEPLSEDEHIHFPEPFGRMEAFCTAGGLSTLTEGLVGKVRHLDHKTIRWPGHAHQIRFLLGLGLGEDRNIDVRTHLTYRDVLVRRMKQHLSGDYEDAVLMRVLIKGRQAGQERTLVYEMIDSYDEETGMTAMKRCTSIPSAAAALMIASEEVSGGGAAPPENVFPGERYCQLVAELGLRIETTWYDGLVDVRSPEASQPIAQEV